MIAISQKITFPEMNFSKLFQKNRPVLPKINIKSMIAALAAENMTNSSLFREK
ncbi:hypothetical protein [Nitrosomonas aestuarii]|uniref:hypothetical protein n=1 Tax=Nitrosomonas aestuarii TaxID=52441 RepID=UPI0015E71431|nr:hypothetical protein [Nitrosomonas aestuarii]